MNDWTTSRKRELEEYCVAHGLSFMQIDKANPMECAEPKGDRQNIEYITPALTGAIMFTDVDAVTERNGFELEVEFKTVKNITQGQSRRFRLTTLPGCNKTVFVVVAPGGRPLEATYLKEYHQGRISEWKSITYDDLVRRINAWSRWADKHKTPQLIAYLSAPWDE